MDGLIFIPARLIDQEGDVSERRKLIHLFKRNIRVKHLADTGQKAYDGKRIAAQIEEIIVEAYRFDIELTPEQFR
ncbi:hypothetical protein SDC9_194205 [bioreactor metagenome]|uniref:Uncharacterized protein n=1 Tax=bioreactor metagenome TaxID=1076179 RepID=A0A645IE98_9ZZZZ